MISKFSELFEYNFRSNQSLIQLFNQEYELVSEKSLRLINHILNAHQVWNSRIINAKSFGVWQMNDFSDLISINEMNWINTKKILDEFQLNQTLSYKNSKGDEFENSLEDILFHVINHSTYHRGQIAMLFRDSAIEPLVSDYIFYKRN